MVKHIVKSAKGEFTKYTPIRVGARVTELPTTAGGEQEEEEFSTRKGKYTQGNVIADLRDDKTLGPVLTKLGTKFKDILTAPQSILLKHLTRLPSIFGTEFAVSDTMHITNREEQTANYGSYLTLTDSILVSTKGDVETILHEATHAATSNEVNKHIIKGEPVTPLGRRLMALIDVAKKADVDNDFSIELGRPKEFITEAMNNPEFQKFLAKVRSPLSTSQRIASVWKDFVKVVQEMIGMDDISGTVLNDAIAVTSELFVGPDAKEQAKGPFFEKLDKKKKINTQAQVNKFNQDQKTPEKKKREKEAKQKEKKSLVDKQFPNRTLLEGISGRITKLDTAIFSFDAALNGEIIDAMKEGLKDKRKAFGIFGQETWKDISETFLRIGSSAALHARGIGSVALEYGRPVYKTIGSFWTSDPRGDADRPSYAKVMKGLKAYGKELGVSPKSVREMAHNAFVAVRAHGIRAKNQEVENTFKTLKRQNKNKEAKNFWKNNFIPIDLTDAQIDNGVEVFNESPGLQKIHQDWIDAKNDIIALQVEHELMDAEMAKEFSQIIDIEGIEAFDDYVGFFRDGQEQPSQYSQQQGDRGKFFKLKGSFIPVADVFDNMESWIRNGVTRSVLNRAAINKVEAAFEHLPGDIKEVAKVTEETPNTVSFSRIDKETKKRTVKNYQFSSPYFAQAFSGGTKSLDLDGYRFMRNTSNFLRTNVVLYPLFSLSQMILQDAGSAMFNSGVRNPLMIPLRMIKEFPLTLLNMSKTHNEMRRGGFTGTYDSWTQGETLSDERIKNETGLYAKMTRAINNVPGLGGDVKFDAINPNTPVSIKRFLGRIAMASDNAVRQAVYEQTMAETGNKGLAMSRGAEIINFKRAGSNPWVTLGRHVIPFFGAFLQATAIQGRVVTGKGVSAEQRAFAATKFLNSGVQLTAITLAYSLMMQDDDEYQKLDPKIKDRRFLLGNGVHVSLRPDIYTFLFKVMPEQVLNNMLGNTDNKKVADALKRSLAEAFLMNRLVPQALRPIMDLSYNFDPRSDRAITPTSLKDLPPGQQYTMGTSETAKFMSQYVNLEKLGISPTMIDFFLRQYFGYTGGLIMMFLDSMIEDSQVLKYARPTKSDRDKLASYPGMSNFLSREYGNRFTSDFYELKAEVDKAVGGYNIMREDDYDQELADEHYKKYRPLIDAQSELRGYMNKLTTIRDQRSKILKTTRFPRSETGKEITGEDKRKALKRLNEREEIVLKSIVGVRQRIYGTTENEELKILVEELKSKFK